MTNGGFPGSNRRVQGAASAPKNFSFPGNGGQCQDEEITETEEIMASRCSNLRRMLRVGVRLIVWAMLLALWPIGLPPAELASAGAPAKAGAGQRRTERGIFVAVTNVAGEPVRDLGAGDFEVREDGVPRTVLKAGLADGPMRVAVLVDNSDAASQSLNNIRSGLQRFLDALPATHEIVLITTGRQLRVRANVTTDRAKLNDAAREIFPDSGSGSVLLDALLETDKRFLDRAENRWPVFVVVTTDGAESSTSTRESEFNQFVNRLIERGGVVHALVLSTRGGGLQTAVAVNLTQNTGGHYEALAASTALPEKLAALAKLMNDQHARVSNQYRIVYASEASNPQVAVQVGVVRSGLRLQVLSGRRVQ